MKKLFLITSLFSVAGSFGMEQSTPSDLHSRLARAETENRELKAWYQQQGHSLPPEPSFYVDMVTPSYAPKRRLTQKDITQLTYVRSSVTLGTVADISSVDPDKVERLEAYNNRLKHWAAEQGFPAPTSSSQSYVPVNPTLTPKKKQVLTAAFMRQCTYAASSFGGPKDIH